MTRAFQPVNQYQSPPELVPKAGHWTALTHESIVGTGGMIKAIDTGAGMQAKGFYRVVETHARKH